MNKECTCSGILCWNITYEIRSSLVLINILSDHFLTNIKLKWFADAASALIYLHSLKVVVGDLKPTNTLVIAGTKDDWLFKLANITPETRKRIWCSSAMSSRIQGKGNFTYAAVFLAPEVYNLIQLIWMKMWHKMWHVTFIALLSWCTKYCSQRLHYLRKCILSNSW